ncbi:hypothetical protein cand_024070 [Cryptosporidium andersoni]|uniref:UFSP1/2/DUB catalytic domain-containing protein n=1 Tax=Cryptosporidium andersoni TaxID=117008 RepID=A0A1J4MRL0_9CRYT|nr:hypothetical protein cand_024070 [Cryptosporidium andersoni]
MDIEKVYLTENVENKIKNIDLMSECNPDNFYLLIGIIINEDNYKDCVIITDIFHHSSNIWDGNINDLIKDINTSLPIGFNIVGIINYNEDVTYWIEDLINNINMKYLYEIKVNPLKLMIIPKYSKLDLMESVITYELLQNGMKIELNLLNTIICNKHILSKFGYFIASEINFSFIITKSEDIEIIKKIKKIMNIIECNSIFVTRNLINNEYVMNFFVSKGNNILKTDNKITFQEQYKNSNNIDDKDNFNIPYYIPMYFFFRDDFNGNNINELVSSYNEEDNIIKDNETYSRLKFHFVGCTFNFNNKDNWQENLRQSFLNQCEHFILRLRNRTDLYNKIILSYNLNYESYIFKIKELVIPIILANTGSIFLNEDNEKIFNNDKIRKEIRKLWLEILNINYRPLISKEFALKLSVSDFYKNDGKLISPHNILLKSIKTIGKKNLDFTISKEILDNEIYKIEGDYWYFHYFQDNIDDIGWGCTYRSLQTVLSWYLLNNYSIKPILNHYEIQKILKYHDNTHEELEIGSNTWIGTIEVSYILSIYLGIRCKIMYFHNIDEFIQKYDILINHFEIISSPIIISIGNYSYILVGIRTFQNIQNNVEYLILDPHYKGDDNIDIIIRRGWVGWKTPNFFKSNSKDKFVNILLPTNIAEFDSDIIY